MVENFELVCLSFYYRNSCYTTTATRQNGAKNGELSERATKNRMRKKSIKPSTARMTAAQFINHCCKCPQCHHLNARNWFHVISPIVFHRTIVVLQFHVWLSGASNGNITIHSIVHGEHTVAACSFLEFE